LLDSYICIPDGKGVVFIIPGVALVQEYLNSILVIVAATNLFTLGIFIIFLLNIRINIRRKARESEFSLRFMDVLQKADTLAQAASRMGITIEKAREYCTANAFETPEERTLRHESIKKRKDEETRRIMEEETIWKAEQEKITEELRREKEFKSRNRRERLRKFGIG